MKKYLILSLSLLFLTSCANRIRVCDKWNQGVIIKISKFGAHGKVLVRFEDGTCKYVKYKNPTLGLYMTEYCKCEQYVWIKSKK